MKWNNCYSSHRSNQSSIKENVRSEFQRDYDRLIFSSAFRRLQNKTQVFPLPGSSTFVHNRLTHSLEVASVGRSLGSLIGDHIASLVEDLPSKLFYTYDLSYVISAGCLAHDIGNPAFGHSGEKAISNYFIKNEKTSINGEPLSDHFSHQEWNDLINFEGNANALRVLTHQYEGKISHGLNLTYATLCSILKYPCESIATDKKYTHRKKYGFFQSELAVFQSIVKESKMNMESEYPLAYQRHPFVYLVEAADDICYRIVDIEDAHRIGILQRDEVEAMLIDLIGDLQDQNAINKTKETLYLISDANEAISYLRAKVIGMLVQACTDVFVKHSGEILAGTYSSSLMDEVSIHAPSLDKIEDVSLHKIYNHPSVIKVELAGYTVMKGLLELFIPAVIEDHPDQLQKKIKTLVPDQYNISTELTSYHRVMSILDFVSGMTDDYAMDMYRKFMGIEIANHN